MSLQWLNTIHLKLQYSGSTAAWKYQPAGGRHRGAILNGVQFQPPILPVALKRFPLFEGLAAELRCSREPDKRPRGRANAPKPPDGFRRIVKKLKNKTKWTRLV